MRRLSKVSLVTLALGVCSAEMALADRLVESHGPFTKTSIAAGTATLEVSSRMAKDGYQNKINLNAKKLEKSIVVATYEKYVNREGREAIKERYNIESVRSTNETIINATIDLKITAGLALIGEKPAKLLISYDGKEVLIDQLNPAETPLHFYTNITSEGPNNFTAALIVQRKNDVTPDNNIRVDIKQVGTDDLNLYVRNESCDQDDDSTVFLEGEVIRERLLPWFWKTIETFRVELTDRACKENVITLQDVSLKARRATSVRYHIVKTNSGLFSTSPSPERHSNIILIK